MSINYQEKKRLIDFIANMKQTGQTAHEALEFFADQMTTNQDLKKVVARISKEVRKGHDIETMLHKENVINNLQYAILSNSPDKNTAYDNVLSYTENAKEADKFYRSNFLKVIAMWAVMFQAMVYLINLYSNMAEQFKSAKDDLKFDFFFELLLSSSLFMQIMVFVTCIFGVLMIVFYQYSYKHLLSLHYRLFKLKALDDGYLYLKMVNDTLLSGGITGATFDIFSKYMYPISCRPICKEISQRLTKNQDISEQLKKLGVIDDAIFSIKTSRAMQDPQGGFKKAYVVTGRYLYDQKAREEYIEKLKYWFFIWFNIPLMILVSYMTYASIAVS